MFENPGPVAASTNPGVRSLGQIPALFSRADNLGQVTYLSEPMLRDLENGDNIRSFLQRSGLEDKDRQVASKQGPGSL